MPRNLSGYGRRRRPSGALRVAVSARPDERGLARLLRRAAEFALGQEGVRAATLSIAVVDARAMARLHAQFSGIAESTDVLTFDLSELPGAALDGQIVVCRTVAQQVAARSLRRSAATLRGRGDEAARALAARRLSRAVAAELALYVLHGVLHLCGYDDQTPADFERIHTREDQLLHALGLSRRVAAPRR